MFLRRRVRLRGKSDGRLNRRQGLIDEMAGVNQEPGDGRQDQGRAEAGLETGGAGYRLLVEQLPYPVLIAEPGGRILYLNPALTEQYGYSLAEVPDRETWRRKVFPDPEYRRLVARESFWGQTKEPKQRRVERRITCLDGTIREVEVYVVVMPDGNTYFIHHDLTERKRAEAALRENEARFRLLAEHSPFPVFIAERTGKILYVSPTFTEQFGYRLDDIPDRETMRERLFPDPEYRRQAAKESFWGKAEEPKQRKVERRVTCRDGTVKEVEVYAIAMPDGTLYFIHHDLTERKRAEAALKENEARFRLLTEHSPMPVLLISPEDKILYVSPSFTEVFGYSLEEIPDRKTMREKFFPDAEYHRQVVQELGGWEYSPDQQVAQSERRITCKDGGVKEVGVFRIKLPDKSHYFILQDVTGRKLAEAALKESESKYRNLFEMSPVSLWLEDCSAVKARLEELKMSGVEDIETYLEAHPEEVARCAGLVSVLDVNQTTLDLLEAPSKEELTKGLEGLLTPKAMEVFKEEIVSFFKRTTSFSTEIDHRTFTGKTKELAIQVTAQPGYEEDLGRVLVAMQDITERKRAEERLKASEESYRNIFRSINDCIYTHDLEGRLTSLNPAAVLATGYREEEILGRSILELIEPRQGERFKEEYLAPLLREGCAQGTIKLISRDGSPRYMEYSCSLVRQEGKEAWVSCLGRDVTGRILGERRLKDLEERLRQAQKMEAIGTLAGGVAHDFNNILGAIIGYAELGLDPDQEDERTNHYLKQIHQAGIRARDLVKQILTFSRKSEQQLIPLDVVPLVKETLKFLRSSLPTTIDIRLENRLEQAVILADPIQIHQILMNLSTNSAQAMREGRGVLEIGLAELELGPTAEPGLDPPAGRYLELSVVDTGQGMDQATLERIFEPYFTTKEPGEGTGLGLAVVHGIVKSHGGEIRVESRPGQGAAFRIYLPLSQDETSEESEAEEPAPLPGQERILLVDDEKALVDLNSQLLERLGYRVTGLTSSPEALELFSQDPGAFDLVITDQTMPRMTGTEMAKKMMRLRPDLPIILCTGYSDQISPESARRMGIKGFLFKPMVRLDLTSAIRQVLEGREPG